MDTVTLNSSLTMGLLPYCLLALFAISGVLAGEFRLGNPRFMIHGYNVSTIRAEA